MYITHFTFFAYSPLSFPTISTPRSGTIAQSHLFILFVIPKTGEVKP